MTRHDFETRLVCYASSFIEQGEEVYVETGRDASRSTTKLIRRPNASIENVELACDWTCCERHRRASGSERAEIESENSASVRQPIPEMMSSCSLNPPR